MATKVRIAEQINRLLAGNPTIQGRYHQKEIMLLVEQVANKLLKADHFAVNVPEGDTIPNNLMMFTYDNVPVTTYKTTKSRAKLPSIPISLPRNMGVFHISKTDAIDEPFIPIPSGMYGIIKPQDVLGELSGLIGYEVIGSDVVFTKNLPALGVSSVFMRLVGVDISQLGDYDILPVSADMEADIVTTVYNIIAQTPPADRAQNINN